MRGRLSKYPQTVVTVALMVVVGAWIIAGTVWEPVLWLGLAAYVGFMLWGAWRADRKAP